MIQKIKKFSSINTLVIFAIILGIAFGAIFPNIALKQQLIGQIFINLLKMLVVPLVFSSIYISILGLGNIESLKTIGIKTIGLYLLTTTLATFSALIAMNIVPIGEKTSIGDINHSIIPHVEPFSFQSMLLSFIPTNIFDAFANGSMMQIIVFSSLFGIASLYLNKQKQKLMLDFFTSISDVMLIIAEWIIKLTPIAVFSLISFVVAQQGIDIISGLWKYMLMVILVLIFHAVITLPSLLAIFARINPFKYLSDIREAPIMAFSTASSAATLPVSMRVAQEMGEVEKKNISFVLPLGATISMDGTAAYLVIATLYISNLAGISLSFMEQMYLCLTVIALSVGVAALPSASLVMMVVILNQLGLPVEYLALIVAVDRILDMARTSLNVTSDLVVVKIVDQLQKIKKQNV